MSETAHFCARAVTPNTSHPVLQLIPTPRRLRSTCRPPDLGRKHGMAQPGPPESLRALKGCAAHLPASHWPSANLGKGPSFLFESSRTLSPELSTSWWLCSSCFFPPSAFFSLTHLPPTTKYHAGRWRMYFVLSTLSSIPTLTTV